VFCLLFSLPLTYRAWVFSDDSRCFDVLERGLVATPHSPELWVFYLKQLIAKGYTDRARAVFQRAAQVIGLDYKSSEFWDMYISFETGLQNFQQVASIYHSIIRHVQRSERHLRFARHLLAYYLQGLIL